MQTKLTESTYSHSNPNLVNWEDMNKSNVAGKGFTRPQGQVWQERGNYSQNVYKATPV